MESFATDRRATCSVRAREWSPMDDPDREGRHAIAGGWTAVDPTMGPPNHLSENGAPLAKPNYQYQKRQKELEKKKKQEEKRKRKLDSKAEPEPDPNAEAPVAGEETPPV